MPYSAAISAIVTFHREGPIAAQTLRGMERLRIFAEHRDIAVQFVAVLDCSDAETAGAVQNCGVLRAGDVVLPVQNRDLGASRNSGVTAAAGEFIGFFDGDDYYSDNWLFEAHQVARQAPSHRVVHPEFQVSFGAVHCVMRLLDMEEQPDYPMHNCLAVHPWIACSFAHRTIYEHSLYVRSDTRETGFGFEDWQWNLEVVAAGCRHVRAPGTAHFYRRKPSSMLTEMVASNAVIRPTRFFDHPERWDVQAESHEQRKQETDTREGVAIVPPGVVESLRILANIEPGLEPTAEFLNSFIPYVPPLDLGPGTLYRAAHGQGGGVETDIVCLVPRMDGSASCSAAIRAIADHAAKRRVLVISTTSVDAGPHGELPEGFSLLAFGELASGHAAKVKALVLGRLMLQSNAGEVVVLQSDLGWHAVRAYGRSLVALGKRVLAGPWPDASEQPSNLVDVTDLVQGVGAGDAQARQRLDVIARPIADESPAASRSTPTARPWHTVFHRVMHSARRLLNRGTRS